MPHEKISRRQLLQGSALVALGAMPLSALAQKETTVNSSANPLETLRREHPRLIASPSSWQTLKVRRAQDALLDDFLKRGEREARALLGVAPVTYDKKGRRLLGVSRTVLRRVLLLSMHFHLTGDEALARRAKDEMLAAAAFADWNPSHFLDTGEMTMALAFGYDWLFGWLDAESKQKIKSAIIEKGLRAGQKTRGWANSTNNWNQVCLGGMLLGGLAIAEDEPALATEYINLVRTNNIRGLRPYMPDGVYPEGAMYWGYGTTFQTVLLGALESALGTDFGISKSPGFLQSLDALHQQLSPNGIYFNFFDGVERIGLEPAPFWFARALQRPDLLTFDLNNLKAYGASTTTRPESQNDRLLPLAALWWPTAPVPETVNKPNYWLGRGPNPLAVFRSAWNDRNAMFLAAKGGKATLSHGHMDAGSFIFEANGVRWGRDLGMQDYYSLESKGVNMWDSSQNGDRWRVFRLNNYSHSTLTINNQLHNADGAATITHFSDGATAGAILDLSPVFKGQAEKVARGFVFRPNSHALIRDELEGLKPGDTVRWAMLTTAAITISVDGKEAMLAESGQKLRAVLTASTDAKFETVDATGPQPYDAPNPNFRLLIVNLKAPDNGKIGLAVQLQVNAQGPEPLAQTALANWGLAKA
jgi:hypothetical protein